MVQGRLLLAGMVPLRELKKKCTLSGPSGPISRAQAVVPPLIHPQPFWGPLSSDQLLFCFVFYLLTYF
jgi:hypothetical protein